MNKEQHAKLATIIKQLKAFYDLISTLSDPLEFGFESYDTSKALKLPQAVDMLKEPFSALEALTEEFKKATEVSPIEIKILLAASDSLKTAINKLSEQMVTLLKELQGKEKEQAYKTFTKLCGATAEIVTDEIEAFSMLPVGIPVLKLTANKTMMISLGEVAFRIDKIVIGKEEIPFEFKIHSIANALSRIYTQYGIQTVKVQNAKEAGMAELTALINAMLTILQVDRYALGTVINAIIPVRGGDPFYARFLLTTDGVMAAFFEGRALPPLSVRYASVPEAKKALQAAFEIAAFEEKGAAWTVGELDQVGYALSKLQERKADLMALRGCKFVRVVAGEKDTDESKEGGSYTYATHILTLTHAAFSLNQKTFCGHDKLLGPGSASVILHEVGHVVEFADWRALEAQLAEQSEKRDLEMAHLLSEVELLQKQIDELDRQEEVLNDKHTEEMDGVLMSLAKDADTAASQRQKAAEKAQGLRSESIDAYNKVVQATPEKGPVSIMDAIDAYVGALLAVVKALKAIDVNNITASSVEEAQKAYASAQQAQSTFQQNAKVAKEPYAQVAHNALSTLEKTVGAFVTLSTDTQLAAEARSTYKKKDQQAGEQRKAMTQKFAEQRVPFEKKLKEQQALLSQAKKERTELDAKKDTLREEQIFGKIGSPRLKKFVQFVTDNGIFPMTKYAQNEWKKENHHEFFAEAYHLFLNDPAFLQQASKPLYTWFLKEVYL